MMQVHPDVNLSVRVVCCAAGAGVKRMSSMSKVFSLAASRTICADARRIDATGTGEIAERFDLRTRSMLTR